MIPIALPELVALLDGRLALPDGLEPTAAERIVVDGPVVIDGREAAPGSLFVAFAGERSDGHDHAPQAGAQGAVAVLGSRPTALPTIVVDDARDALQRLASHVVARLRAEGGLRIVGITGSQGKTSTKDLLAAVLADAAPTVATLGSYNNELGMPLTALRADAGTRFLVLEMGARGIGHIAELTRLVTPDVGMVLCVGQAHLSEFGSREAIAQAKGELVECLAPDGVAVLNVDDERVAAMAARTRARVRRFSPSGRPGGPGDVRVEALELDRLGRPTFDLVSDDERARVTLHLIGAHQAANAAAAATAALALGVPLERIGASLGGVASLSRWRMELHERADGVVLLNDAYNANPDSMRAALDALGVIGQDPATSRTLAVLGEMRELGDVAPAEHAGVGAYAVERGVDRLLVVGEAARDILVGAGSRADDVWVADAAAATAWLREHVGPGDAVLFKASNGARLFEVAAALR
ncbi:UDP-N-acetylmuramoyl-tripeptide--D-alanyl-D-alanine ligase [Nocardioides sp. TRM66260-LWL]|uniref:UDP-N-acetylmuramoyl-tripeptide--D-alanyl-D- alanine ligase n=1 Tax=Nocardioides sp. TRM66260-LWL TaxID=2874478 RepID=UPI001CC4B5B3|nr:UDP-N-acetylmuramoyl-tripeptide--D-alanyl-D-alanine ligase [Nocardioides sp. TRM66260-LWL]MBZ5733134.1 UDP-N-acetylmuramoyl-tripeptide--D-alanyl-D-alanine ligase [Nocardioides sp. TRM66260-LWL]